MSKKGGYQIIDLKGLELTDEPTIAGIYDAIEGNYHKPILLSGIVIDGVEKADVYTIPTLRGTTFILKNIYGYDVEIDSENNVVISHYSIYEGATASDIKDKKLFADGTIYGIYIHFSSGEDSFVVGYKRENNNTLYIIFTSYIYGEDGDPVFEYGVQITKENGMEFLSGSTYSTFTYDIILIK